MKHAQGWDSSAAVGWRGGKGCWPIDAVVAAAAAAVVDVDADDGAGGGGGSFAAET